MTNNLLTDPVNHPANGPLTAERIERVIEALEISLRYRNGSSHDHFIADAVKGLRELRESREAAAEPVAWQYREHNPTNGMKTEWNNVSVEDYQCLLGITDPETAEFRPLYAAPPAPAMPEDWQQWIADAAEYLEGGLEVGGELEAEGSIEAKRLLSRRAAMLSAEKLNQPVSGTESLPLDYLQGHKDGQEWSAQMAEANHPQTGDWLYDDPIALAAAIRKGPDMPLADGNSPVTPDGWVMVPVEPTKEMIDAGWLHFMEANNPSSKGTYKAMIAAASQK